MNSMATEPAQNQVLPEELRREASVPNNWEDELDRQEDFIGELLGDKL